MVSVLNFFAVIIAILSVCAVFYIFECSQIFVIVSVLISLGCCCYLTVKQGKPFVLKLVSLILSGITLVPILLFSFMSLIFGNLGQNTVVQTIDSPNGTYYTQVFESDQGALGGNTVVDVYQKSRFEAVFFKIEKNPKRVYTGDWGEFKNMQIYWKDDRCLVVNSVEHTID